MLYPNQTVNDPESAMQINFTAISISQGGPPGDPHDALFSSGGGFSNYFDPPSYQKAAVSRYLSRYAPKVASYVVNADASNIGVGGGVYNRAGRGYPDVSYSYLHRLCPYHHFCPQTGMTEPSGVTAGQIPI